MSVKVEAPWNNERPSKEPKESKRSSVITVILASLLFVAILVCMMAYFYPEFAEFLDEIGNACDEAFTI